MWIPSTTDEIVAAVAAGTLSETHIFDAKRQLGTGLDIATDVCAMTVDGGTLVYGIGEDDNKRLTVDAPFALADHAERIDQIVHTSIQETPAIEIRPFPLSSDPARGYLLVIVPQSPRAPHMVIVRGKNAYYGRGATGNRLLSESEVASLYARRDRWEIDREQHLEAVIRSAPDVRDDLADERRGFLHAFVKPIGFEPGFLRQELETDQRAFINAILLPTFERVRPNQGYAPDFDFHHWDLDGASGIAQTWIDDPRTAFRASIAHDGETRLFCNCTVEMQPAFEYQNESFVVLEYAVAGNFGRLLAMSGLLYERARYFGVADVGVAVTGIDGAISATVAQSLPAAPTGYPHPSFRRTSRVTARDLIDDPEAIATELLRHFLDAVVGLKFNPFASRTP